MNQISEYSAAGRAWLEAIAGIFAGGVFEGKDGSYVWEFIFVTLIMGGLAASSTGKAIAGKWGPYQLTIVYVVLLGLAVRFLHFALFQRTLLSVHYYVIDELFLQAIALWSFRSARAGQMSRQYRWMFERSGSTTWLRRAEAE